ncbi:hypothetical protein KI387_030350, partial [Taxus chinensis]
MRVRCGYIPTGSGYVPGTVFHTRYIPRACGYIPTEYPESTITSFHTRYFSSL